MKIVKWLFISITTITIVFVIVAYIGLRASLPTLDGDISTSEIKGQATLARDALGTAIINTDTENDAAYLMGYAHAQDRLFQMDLLRRQSAGELSEIAGERALNLDKKHRIHQFRKRAENTFKSLSKYEQQLLLSYTNGVNAAAKSLSYKPFEYILTGSDFAPWKPEDSLLASYSMYIDLQLSQTEIDFRLTALKEIFGDSMHQFFTLPSTYQSAIDYTVVSNYKIDIPNLPVSQNDEKQLSTLAYFDSVVEQPDFGSNNWAVAGQLTNTKSAMLSNDMHLGLRVPAIWYKAQINFSANQKDITVTGVSLPGTPSIIVGSNTHVAWGFTNSNVDNVDWVKLDENTQTTTITETIVTPEDEVDFNFELSEYGPVREFNGERYALKWVAHQEYALNIQIANMAKATSIDEALALSKIVRIPVQNMVVADSEGKVAFQLTGAMSERKPIARHAITEDQFSQAWSKAQFSPANHINPKNGRVWSGNARVIGTDDLVQFGDGGYALGARQQQIYNLLIQQDSFSESDFYDIQLNNQALFLKPWHKLLLKSLQKDSPKYKKDIEILSNWGECACADSVGYTLVRRFRSTVINQLLAPINEELKNYDLSTSYILKGIEPAIWAILDQQPVQWLPKESKKYSTFLQSAFETTKERLIEQHRVKSDELTELRWGNVNALRIKHPFSSVLGPFRGILDMEIVEAFGDSYLPAVQANSFGASQRLIVRPGNEEKAILTIPGGQSGHFLSPYYRTGFDEYSAHANSSLLPLAVKHEIVFTPNNMN